MQLTGGTYRRLLRLAVFILLIAVNPGFSRHAAKKPAHKEDSVSLYEQLDLPALGLKRLVFEKALKGWEQLKGKQGLEKPSLLTIVDMSQSGNAKRLYIVDLESKTVLFNTYVSHGRNSGDEFAKQFGNKPESFKSSLGFYVTGATYTGQHGISMRLRGLEKGVNHCAEQRGIVMHGADYATEKFIKQYGRLGRSLGCPAVSPELCQPIVDCIKGGSCFFVYYPDSNYFRSSVFYN